jgi:hypothetical protein
MESEVIYTGEADIELLQNEYGTGDILLLKYRHGNTWKTYGTPFASLGYIQLRVESTL